jgi:hypothetical protein
VAAFVEASTPPAPLRVVRCSHSSVTTNISWALACSPTRGERIHTVTVKAVQAQWETPLSHHFSRCVSHRPPRCLLLRLTRVSFPSPSRISPPAWVATQAAGASSVSKSPSATAAAAALAHAAASGAEVPGSPAVSRPPVGQPLTSAECVYNIDHPAGVPQELEVSPITVYNSDYNLSLGQSIAVNRNYICYGLKAGQIRVINLFTAGRALMRGHEAPLCDLKFFGEEVGGLGCREHRGRAMGAYGHRVCRVRAGFVCFGTQKRPAAHAAEFS